MDVTLMAVAGSAANSQDTFTPEGEHSNTRGQVSRILCPVIGCPDPVISSNRHHRNFNSIKGHLNDHCTGHLSGAVPAEFLTRHDYSQCRLCERVLHNRYNGICTRCRPIARAREQINALRLRNINPTQDAAPSQQAETSEQPRKLPSLSVIHKQFVPTIKNVPLVLRRLWSQCIVQALAQAVWTNNESGWK